jgi:hypothetical protein
LRLAAGTAAVGVLLPACPAEILDAAGGRERQAVHASNIRSVSALLTECLTIITMMRMLNA